MYLKVSSMKWHPFCLGLNVLKSDGLTHRGLSKMANIFSEEILDVFIWNKILYFDSISKDPVIIGLCNYIMVFCLFIT